MGNGFRWFAVVLTVALVAAVGVFTYNLGVAHGAAASAVAAPAAPGVPYVFYPRPWGWGFGFGPFFGLLWVFVLFALLRRLWWGPRWYGRGCRGYRDGGGVPPQFDAWHRRAHAQQPPEPTRL